MRRVNLLSVSVSTILLIAWLFVGVMHVVDENETYNVLFLKRSPTLRLVFRNPYASVPFGPESEYSKRMDASGDWLPGSPELDDYLIYCKARYAIELPDPIEAREQCGRAAAQIR